MKIQLSIVAVLGLSFAFPAAAAPAAQEPAPQSLKEKKIRKLLEVTGAAAMGKQVMDTMLDHFSKSVDLPEGFIEKFKETANPGSLVELIVPIYVKHLDEETLDGTIAFFESPAGRKFVKAQPLIMKESMEAGQKWGAEAAQKTLKALEK
jgi:hypothetical protein